MSTIAFLRNISIYYKIPIILSVILCGLLIFWLAVWIYEKYFYRESLEIIYDKSKNDWKEIKAIPQYSGDKDIHLYYVYKVCVRNKTRTRTECISVFVDDINIKYSNPSPYIEPGETRTMDLYAVAFEDEHRGKQVTITVTGKDIKPTIRNITL